eukprot:scaffold20.g7881.t1
MSQVVCDALLRLVGQRLQRGLGAVVGAAAAAALLLGGAEPAGAQAIAFPLASSQEVFRVQHTMLEAWGIVTKTYVDPTFNHTAWDRELMAALESAAATHTADEASKLIPEMLAKLGDPYTRWAPPNEYNAFRISSDGELQASPVSYCCCPRLVGVGLLIAADPSNGRLVVLAPIKGSPAERAGIRPGDELVNVGGASTRGWTGDMAAARLRGESGSAVWVKVARHRDQVPGQVAGSRALWEGDVEYKQFKLQRDRVELSPVFATAMRREDDDHTYGYIRLTSFSQHAADDMRKAILQLRRDGADSFILDLRNNPGGLVQASLDTASLWLSGSEHPTIFNIQERGADDEQELSRIGLDGGTALATEPLVVLVNKNSASASEILAGALHDNHRAEVIGDPTFGKGKIQSVFELRDGSALFVTVAKYKTPALHDIDNVGVRPDAACRLPAGAGADGAGGAARAVTVPGIPIGPGVDEQVIAELETDDCVLHAEALLGKMVDRAYSSPPSMHLASAPPPRA